MTYTPPLNGGRINVTLAGNSTSAGGGYALASTGTLTLAGGNNITLSQNANAITISGGAGGGGVALYDGAASITSGTASLADGNGVSFGINGQTITGSVAAQTNQTLGIYGSSQTFGQSSSGTYDARSLTFVGRGDASVGWSNGSFMISDNPQSVQTVGLYGVSNTTQSSTATVDARSMSFAGAGIASVGATGGSVVISVPSGGGAGFTAGVSNIGNTAGNTGTTNNELILAGGNNVTLSQATGAGGYTVTVSSPNMFNEGLSNIGNTSGTSGTFSNQVVWAGGNAITLSQSTGAGGATISVSGPTPVTLSSWEPWPIHNTGTAVLSANTNTSGSASFIPFVLDQNVAAGYLNMIQSYNLTTGGTSTFSQSGTLNYGLYTRGAGANSTTLSQLTSGSYSYQVSYNNSTMTVSQVTASATNGLSYGSTTSAGLNISSGYTGLKLVQLPIASTLTPGNYWLGLMDRASTVGFNSGIKYSYLGNAMTLTAIPPIGSFSASYTTGTNLVGGNGNWMVGLGVFQSANQTNLPNTLAISAMTANISMVPYMKFVVS